MTRSQNNPGKSWLQAGASVALVALWVVILGCVCLPQIAVAASHEKEQKEFLPEWLRLDGEYRLRSLRVEPLDIGGEKVDEARWSEQRFRLDFELRHPDGISLIVQLDALDGVLMGDNGRFGQSPSPNSGLGLASRKPNVAGTTIGLSHAGADPFDRESYVPVLESRQPLELNWVFAEARFPVGMLRVGRQPFTVGPGMAGHDGGRHNRWGVSHYSHTADRVLFGTKLDEIINAIRFGSSHKPDPSKDNGLFLVGAYDWTVQDEIISRSDDLHQTMSGLLWRKREADWLGQAWRDITVLGFMLYKFGDDFHTDVYAFPFRVSGTVGKVHTNFQLTAVTGSTREISAGYAILSGGEAQDQELRSMGAHGEVTVELGPTDWTFQMDYASGDDDPRPSTPWHGFTFARDFNIGLLLFEHVMAFESARSAAVGMETLANSGATSFPLSEVATDGRFTNAVAFFPQLRVRWLDTHQHKLQSQFGVLMAWPAANGVVDPVATIRGEDGDSIRDDAVNFHGGKPGSYYGTELDAQFSWTWRDIFSWTLEAAVLFPGSSLENKHGDAVNSFLLENRLEFLF